MKEAKGTKKSMMKQENKFDDYKNFLELKKKINQGLKIRKWKMKKLINIYKQKLQSDHWKTL